MPKLDFVEVERTALRRRDEAGLHPEDAVPDVVDLIERLGIPAAVWPFGPHGPDGLYVQDKDDRLVVLNSEKYMPRFRFTAAHELAHATYEDGSRLDVDVQSGISDKEKRANAFAAIFLVTTRALKARVPNDVDPEVVLNLASEFGVSFPALVYRLHNAGVIGATARDRLLAATSAIAVEQLREHPGNEKRLPDEFVRRSQLAYEHYEITLQRFSELLRRDADDVRGKLDEAGLLHPEDRRPHPIGRAGS